MNLVWIPGRHRAETAQLPHAIGDKAARLVQLTEAGFTVPPLYCITTAAFRLAVEADRSNPSLSDLLASLADAPASASRAYCGSQVRTAILNRPLLPELECEIAAAHAKLFAEDVCVAVRSSIVGEDGDDGAFAGMHDSVLAVRSQTELFDAVRRVHRQPRARQPARTGRQCGPRSRSGPRRRGVQRRLVPDRQAVARSHHAARKQT